MREMKAIGSTSDHLSSILVINSIPAGGGGVLETPLDIQENYKVWAFQKCIKFYEFVSL